jgi:hypothetical protein
METHMYWWIVGLVLAFFVIRAMWRAYTDPSHVLGRQAANMNWVVIGRVTDKDGYKNMKLGRNGMEAVISFKDANVELIKPGRAEPFQDFIELERWLANEEQESVNDEALEYYQEVNNFINSHGFYEPFLELQGTDNEYCIASMQMHKAGYLSGQSEKVVGALTLDSIKKYEQNRQLAILFLKNLEQDFLSEDEEDSDDYHPSLDKAVGETESFLENNNIYVPLRGNGAAISVTSELFVYIASYLAMLSSGENIAAMSWNSFKSSIENRIRATIENPPSLSDSIVTSDSTTFVHYASEYFAEMTRMEELLLKNKYESGNYNLQPLIAYLLRTLGSDKQEHQSQLQDYLSEVSGFASQEIVPKVVRAFG